MHATNPVIVQPSGGGMPLIGNAVALAVLGAGGLACGAPDPAALPGPEAARLCTVPPPKLPLPRIGGLRPNVPVPNELVDGEVGRDCDTNPDAATLACASPKLMEVVAV